MNVIFLSGFCRNKGSIKLCVPYAAPLLSVLGSGLVATLLWLGYQWGAASAAEDVRAAAVESVGRMLAQERRVIEAARAEQRDHLDALAMRIATLRAGQMRLDALGDRLVSVGKLDPEEFDFSSDAPLGGAAAVGGDSQDAIELSRQLDQLDAFLSDREEKLVMLDRMLMNGELLREILPSGRPVTKGWVSSSYGRRTDPFSGKKTTHRGMDFAGKRGSDVVAVASGVVTRSKKVAGYGNVIEIRHADGFSTLYGHNEKNLVEVGDMVGKGDVIALLGSTGRSSGPHVHFEVHKNGRIVNPRKFVKAH